MDNELILSDIVGFEWDKGNTDKNWKKHKVSREEAEQVFINKPLLLYDDIRHSTHEKRHYALGKTSKGIILFISLTIRDYKIRIISARPANRKEKKIYEKS